MAHRSKPVKGKNAIAILKRDHAAVKELFERFEKNQGRRQIKEVVAEAIRELKVHAAIEEELFYPAVRNAIEDDEGLLEEAHEEHHVAKVLIAEIELMSGEEDNFGAKFYVLAESVRHHIKEEEGELFPKAMRSGIDLEALGEQMWRRKQQLSEEGVPPDAEMMMVHRAYAPASEQE